MSDRLDSLEAMVSDIASRVFKEEDLTEPEPAVTNVTNNITNESTTVVQAAVLSQTSDGTITYTIPAGTFGEGSSLRALVAIDAVPATFDVELAGSALLSYGGGAASLDTLVELNVFCMVEGGSGEVEATLSVLNSSGVFVAYTTAAFSIDTETDNLLEFDFLGTGTPRLLQVTSMYPAPA